MNPSKTFIKYLVVLSLFFILINVFNIFLLKKEILVSFILVASYLLIILLSAGACTYIENTYRSKE